MAIILLIPVGGSIAISESVTVVIPAYVNWGAAVVVTAFLVWDRVVEKFSIWGGKND